MAFNMKKYAIDESVNMEEQITAPEAEQETPIASVPEIEQPIPEEPQQSQEQPNTTVPEMNNDQVQHELYQGAIDIAKKFEIMTKGVESGKINTIIDDILMTVRGNIQGL